MHVLMLSSSCKSPISYCMLPFADLQLNAEHNLKGGGVPSPEGLQYEGGLRSADLRSAISDLCFRSDTPALAIRQGRRIQSLRAFRRARVDPWGGIKHLSR